MNATEFGVRTQLNHPGSVLKNKIYKTVALAVATLALGLAGGFLLYRGNISRFQIKPLCIAGLSLIGTATLTLTLTIIFGYQANQKKHGVDRLLQMTSDEHFVLATYIQNGSREDLLLLMLGVPEQFENEDLMALARRFRLRQEFTMQEIPVALQKRLLVNHALAIVVCELAGRADSRFRGHEDVINFMIEYQDPDPVSILARAEMHVLEPYVQKLAQRINRLRDLQLDIFVNENVRLAVSAALQNIANLEQ